LKQVAEAWWRDFEGRGVSVGTLRLYRGRLDNHVLPALGHLMVQELTVGRIHRHLSVLAENHGLGTARTIRAILSGICGFAAQRDVLPRNPVRDINLCATSRRPVDIGAACSHQLRSLTGRCDAPAIWASALRMPLRSSATKFSGQLIKIRGDERMRSAASSAVGIPTLAKANGAPDFVVGIPALKLSEFPNLGR
jgi:hypothetical protein